jgi:hypothetical protein
MNDSFRKVITLILRFIITNSMYMMAFGSKAITHSDKSVVSDVCRWEDKRHLKNGSNAERKLWLWLSLDSKLFHIIDVFIKSTQRKEEHMCPNSLQYIFSKSKILVQADRSHGNLVKLIIFVLMAFCERMNILWLTVQGFFGLVRCTSCRNLGRLVIFLFLNTIGCTAEVRNTCCRSRLLYL